MFSSKIFCLPQDRSCGVLITTTHEGDEFLIFIKMILRQSLSKIIVDNFVHFWKPSNT